MSTNAQRIPIGRSRVLFWLLAATHGGAIGCVALLAIPVPIKVAVGCAVLVSFIWCATQHALRSAADAIVELKDEGGAEWRLVSRSGEETNAALLPGGYVHPVLTVLNFAVEGRRRRAVLLLADAIDAAALRRLRTRLRAGTVSRAADAAELN